MKLICIKCPRGCESIFYYEGKDDPNAAMKNRSWSTISYPRRGKAQYQWITTELNNNKHWAECIIDYDKEVEAIKKEIDYLQTWELEDKMRELHPDLFVT